MLAKIKAYLIAGLGILSLIFYALFQKSQADKHKRDAEATADQLAVKVKAGKAHVEGLKRENEIRDDNRDRRGKFT